VDDTTTRPLPERPSTWPEPGVGRASGLSWPRRRSTPPGHAAHALRPCTGHHWTLIARHWTGRRRCGSRPPRALRTAARLSIVQHQARLSGVDHADQGALGRTGRVARHGTAGTVSPLGRPPPRPRGLGGTAEAGGAL